MNRVYAFHGADHKCGTSMIAQCCAERLAALTPGKRILLIHTEGRSGCEYAPEVGDCMEELRPYLADRLIDREEILRRSEWRDNLYVIAGCTSPGSSGSWHPEMAAYLIESLRCDFDLILCDCGSEPEHGLALGAMLSADRVFLVLSPGESGLRRFLSLRPLYEKIGLNIEDYVLNKYEPGGLYDMKYVARRLETDIDNVFPIRMSPLGLRAETDERTLLKLNDRHFGKDLEVLVSYICEDAQLETDGERRNHGKLRLHELR